MNVRPTGRVHRAVVVASGLLVGLVSATAWAGPAAADVSATGPEGQTLTTATATLDPSGTSILVKGSGYDITKGVYLGVCVDNGPGVVGSPCVGGVDMTGQSHSLYWISSNPPPYAVDVVKPYTDQGNGKGGFELNLDVKAADTQGTDCTAPGVKCVIYTRADHTRSSDRTQDVKIPITWGTDPGPENPGTPAGSADQTVSVTVTGGALSLDVAGDAVSLSPAPVGGTATGQMNTATVLDQRGSGSGWSLVGQVTDFSGDAGTIPSTRLGWTPAANGSGVTPGGAVQPGSGLGQAQPLCTAAAGTGTGSTQCDAALNLGIPSDARPGGYSATLTLTLS
ncbi:WxL domain-containing protein [Herbidospora sp. RD11066]